jgi:hypothetical protein
MMANLVGKCTCKTDVFRFFLARSRGFWVLTDMRTSCSFGPSVESLHIHRSDISDPHQYMDREWRNSVFILAKALLLGLPLCGVFLLVSNPGTMDPYDQEVPYEEYEDPWGYGGRGLDDSDAERPEEPTTCRPPDTPGHLPFTTEQSALVERVLAACSAVITGPAGTGKASC